MIVCFENLTPVQVNSADQRLRVFDSTHKRWRQVCSSSANEFLASISCEEVGFVRWEVLFFILLSFLHWYVSVSCCGLRLKCVFCGFQCVESLNRFSAGGQWRRRRVFLRQTGRAQLRQENQRRVVPVVSSSRVSPPVSQQPLPSLCPFSFTSLLGWHTETSTLSSFGCQAVVANCVCLCSSDCESREVLTLLCQGKTFTEIYYHCLTHWGHSLTLIHTLSSSFSVDLCGVCWCLSDTHTSCLVFLHPLLDANFMCVLTQMAPLR